MQAGSHRCAEDAKVCTYGTCLYLADTTQHPQSSLTGLFLVVLPEKVDLLTLQPISHSLVHIIPALIVRVRQIVQDGMTQTVLSSTEVLVSLSILVQLLLWDMWYGLSIHWDHLVLFVEELHKLSLPLTILDLDEEDEPAIAFDVDGNALEKESLRDCGLHLPNTSLLGEIDVGKGAVLTVHNEVAVGSAFDGNLNEFFDGQTTRPC